MVISGRQYCAIKPNPLPSREYSSSCLVTWESPSLFLLNCQNQLWSLHCRFECLEASKRHDQWTFLLEFILPSHLTQSWCSDWSRLWKIDFISIVSKYMFVVCTWIWINNTLTCFTTTESKDLLLKDCLYIGKDKLLFFLLYKKGR